MKRLTIGLAVTVAAVLSAFGQTNVIREDLDLREFLLNGLFKDCAKTNEVCYVAFGAATNTTEDVLNPVVYLDPPPGFLERFAGRPYRVKLASQRPKVRPIRHADISQEDLLLMGNPKNPHTGIPDGAYIIQIKEWIHGAPWVMVRVSVELHRTPLWGRGKEMTLVKTDGEWKLFELLSSWMS